MRCPNVPDLPPPSPGQTGWPWRVGSPQLPDSMPDGQLWPRISIVTPSFNQAQFIEETIRSVLLQGYPNLEYIVIDGGSTDGSADIIRKYEPWLAYWTSGKDRGQSHAINKGWEKATGDLIAYLNSDDTYLLGAFERVARAWTTNRRAAAIVGAFQETDAESRPTSGPAIPYLPAPTPLDLTIIDHEKWFLPQQPGFWSRAALDEVGRWLREDLHYTMDRELYYRLCRVGAVVLIDDVLATYRFHQTSKSVSAILSMYGEAPKALEYCNWGGSGDARKRRKVASWRLAQGHYRFAGVVPSRLRKLIHLLRAAAYRPAYLHRRGFWLRTLDAVYLATPARWIWNRLHLAVPARWIWNRLPGRAAVR